MGFRARCAEFSRGRVRDRVLRRRFGHFHPARGTRQTRPGNAVWAVISRAFSEGAGAFMPLWRAADGLAFRPGIVWRALKGPGLKPYRFELVFRGINAPPPSGRPNNGKGSH